MARFKDKTRFADLVEEAVPLIPEAMEKSGADLQLSDLLSVRVALTTLRRVSRRFEDERGVPWPRFALSAMTSDLRKQLETGVFETDEEAILDDLFPNE